MTPSQSLLASSLPSLENATELTQFECPSSVSRSSPVTRSHSFTDRSELPLANNLPSGEKVTDLTAVVCPWSARRNSPVLASQSCTAPPSLPVANVFPSGENANDQTHGARMLCRGVRVFKSHSSTDSS